MCITQELPFLNKINHPYFNKYYKNDEINNEGVYKVDWVTGAFMFLSRERFINVGGFDEKFFMYYEDVDLCKTVKEHGHSNFYLSSLSCIHKHYVSSKSVSHGTYNKMKVTERQSMLYYLHKHYSKSVIFVRIIFIVIFSFKSVTMFLKYFFLFALKDKRNKNFNKVIGRIKILKSMFLKRDDLTNKQ
jgi:GT2 family glycosyltransferase